MTWARLVAQIVSLVFALAAAVRATRAKRRIDHVIDEMNRQDP